MKRETKTVTILIAEDDPDDQFLIREAFEESRLANPLAFVENGEELLDYLHQRGQYSESDSAPRPGLILLDLNMPRVDGREALAEIKADNNLRSIPIVVLTTSRTEEDIFQTYNLGVSGFITKPVTFDGLVEVIKAMNIYWFEIVELPQ